MSSKKGPKPFVEITEQPAPDRARFRYECEGVSSIIGVHSTPRKKTYPTIRIVGYRGKAVVLVSCVTHDEPYRPHPFTIDGKQECKKGVCTTIVNELNEDQNFVEFYNIGIKRVKKKEIAESLKERQELRVDPFNTGYDMRRAYNFSVVRLCFQVFLKGENGKFTVPLTPVVSDAIFDKKNCTEMVILEISHCVCRVDEQQKIIILCGKIVRDNIEVRFYEEKNGVLVWEDFGQFTPCRVHKEVAISFNAPKYYNQRIDHPVKVLLQLRRPSDNATSQSIPFEFIPSEELGRKRKKMNIGNLVDLGRLIQKDDYNPFMNIRREEATSQPQPIKMEVNAETADIPFNTHQLNLPSTSVATRPMRMNLPQYPLNIPPGPTSAPFQNALLNTIPMDIPNIQLQDGELQCVPEQHSPQAMSFDNFEFTNAFPNNFSNDEAETNRNLPDSFTNILNSMYEGENIFK